MKVDLSIGKGLLAFLLGVSMVTGAIAQGLPEFTWSHIADPGNAAASASNASSWGGGYNVGAVDYEFFLSTHETSNGQYAYFLNTVDPNGQNSNGLYNSNMGSQGNGGILFDSGAAAGEKYSVKSGYSLLPVVFVSWNDTARFVNWLHNGGEAASSTETGVYNMAETTPQRMEGATYWIPSANEWVKAAYYNPDSGTYSLYPTRSNATPANIAPNDVNSNSANFAYAVNNPGDPSGFLNLSQVGGYELAPSYYGTFDQGGNASEWLDTASGSNRFRRGGDWAFGEFYLAGPNSFSHNPQDELGYVGFRIAQVIPEPSTGLLLFLGGAAFLFARTARRRARSTEN